VLLAPHSLPERSDSCKPTSTHSLLVRLVPELSHDPVLFKQGYTLDHHSCFV